MDSYTITVTPNDDSGNHTTLTVDTSTGQPRITNVHLHAPDGLTSGQMPSLDVGLLLQAVTGPSHTATAITAAPAPATPPAAPVHAETRPVDAGVDEPPTAATTAAPQPAGNDTTPAAPAAVPAKRANPRRTAAGRAAEGKTAPSGSARRGRSQPAPTKAAPTKTAPTKATPSTAAPRKATRKQAAAATAAAGAGTERVYRRMPDDFAAVYRQASTAAAIADHYGVPRYTAHSWISRLKKQSTAGRD